MEKNEKGVVYIALYIDDDLRISNLEITEDTVGLHQRNGLLSKVGNDLHDYLSFDVKFSDGKKKTW